MKLDAQGTRELDNRGLRNEDITKMLAEVLPKVFFIIINIFWHRDSKRRRSWSR